MLTSADYKNYTLVEQRELPELEGYGYLLRHNKSGARVLLVENEDKNKVFSIGFRTPPEDDTGVAHILEHSVLCGSEHFPAKDPFVELAKGSLNTFLNAMTYPDKTVYPVASCNAKDYHNLMHVYLDAVFYPNIYKKDEILKQEGWHYEIADKNSELTFNGVVYNEMKGALSSPDAQLERKIQGSLLKDTTYACESGGDPDVIPQLTKEQFLAFHTRFYHPSNSYIYLYGDVDFKEELAFIDQEYLDHFTVRECDSEINFQEPYTEPLLIKDTYSVSEDDEQGVYLSYNVVTGDSGDAETSLAMQMLDYVLFTMPGAPVKQALTDAGIGKEIDSFYDGGIHQPIFSIQAKQAEAGQEEAFIETVETALREQADQGINRRALLSVINNFEFKYRESSFGRYPKGLIYGLNFLNTWLYDDSKAFELADSLTPLARLKERVNTGYFEDLIRKCFLENNHKSYVNLYPEKDKNAKNEDKLKAQLQKVKESLDSKQLYYLIEDTRKLKEYQMEPSSQEELETIPMLDLSDISRDISPFKNRECQIGGVNTVIHDYKTNGILYMNFCFDTTELPRELIPYATLLVDLYRYVDTEHYSYNELATEINLRIGGLYCQTGIYPLIWKKDGRRPYFSFRVKCLEDQKTDAMDLLKEVMFTSRFGDKKRIREILSEIVSKAETRIPASGHVYAANRALSYVDPVSAYKEEAEGLDYYYFLKDFDRTFDQSFDRVYDMLSKARSCIFRPENLTVSLTGIFDFDSILAEEFKEFASLLWTGPCVRSVPEIVPVKKNEGFKTSSQVQYVASAGSFDLDVHPYTGSLQVLKTIMSYDYLWNNVRVTGGAYGAMCSFTREGYGYFTSYRDPNLAETLEVYKGAADYISSFDVSDRDMTKYIIGTISSIDMPLDPSALGARSFSAYQSGITEDMALRERNQILETRQDTIRSLAPYVEEIMDKNVLCAIGNDRKIEENAESFDKVKALIRQEPDSVSLRSKRATESGIRPLTSEKSDCF